MPILYSFRRCPYAMRARLALDVSRQTCELREVLLKNKPEAMVKASSKATVPVLIDVDGTVIDESLDIMLWSLDRHDPEQWLAPDADSLESALSLVRHIDTHFKHHLDRYKYPTRHTDADVAVHRAAASGDVQMLEVRLTRSHYLCGDRLSLADMAIAPFVRQFANVDSAWFADQPWTHVQRWLDAIVSSPRFERIMRPIEVWRPGATGVAFPFSA